MHELLSRQLELARASTDERVDLDALLDMVSLSYFKLDGTASRARQESAASRVRSESDRDLVELILDHVKDAILIVDGHGVIERMNITGERMFGYEPEQVAGSLLSLLVPSAADLPLQLYLESLSQSFGSTHTDLAAHESRAVHRENGFFPVEISVSRVERDRGDFFVVVIRDVTRRKEAETALRDSEHRYRGLFENVVDGVYQTSVDGELISANPALVKMLGFSSARELLDYPFPDELYLLPSERQVLFEALKRDGVVRNFEYSMRLRDGTVRVVIENARAVRDEHGQVVSYEGIVRDITERKNAEMAALKERERAVVTLASIADAVVATDAEGNVDYMNPVAENLTGWELRAARGRPASEIFRLVNQESGKPIESPLARCLREGRSLGVSVQGAVLNRAGERAATHESSSPIRDRNGHVVGAVMVFRDLSPEEGLRRQLSYNASHDQVTKLINRHEFENQLADAIAQTRERPGLVHGLLYLDLDQFKLVNDTFGHAAGDVLLKKIASILQGGVRSDDIIARLGGDEFGVLLMGCNLEKASMVAEELRKSIRDLRFTWSGRALNVAASIGLVELSDATPGAAEAMSGADVACYTAKEAGRNRIHVYHDGEQPGGPSQRHQEMHWISRINDALEQDRFELYYQPIVPIGKHVDHRSHYELLIRMRSSDGEIIAPGAFIPAAERYNLMPALDRWVIRNALENLAALDAKASDSGYTLAINLSGTSLNDPAFQDDLVAQLATLRLAPGTLCFEITETAAIGNLASVAHFMEQLKAQGCLFALDDFGSGLSSFAYLRDLPVDYIKIDGHFITNVANCGIDQSMVDAITRVGQAMGIKTIAERVEEGEVLEILATLGVHYAQGNYIADPRSMKSFRPGEQAAGKQRQQA